MIELWRDIDDYDGWYQVSNLGIVKSLHYGGTYLKPAKDGRGYLFVGLCKNGHVKLVKIHKLVMMAFKPDKSRFKYMPYEDPNTIDFDKLHINHIDENPLNNCVDNLEWCTCAYNINYGTRITRVANKRSKVVYQYDLMGNFIKSYKNAVEAAKCNNLQSGHIIQCCHHQYGRKTTGGYVWMFESEVLNNGN